MPETSQYTFSFRELVESMIKRSDVHEGIWRLFISFGIQGANVVPPGSNDVFPSAIVPVQKIGIQRVGDDEPTDSITVDAVKVNPIPK